MNFIFQKDEPFMCLSSLSIKTSLPSSIHVSLSENVEGSDELNQDALCVYRLSKKRNSGMIKYNNLKLGGNDNRDDQKLMFACYHYC